MKSTVKLAALAAVALVLSSPDSSRAQDAKKVDPTGTWTWSVEGRDGQARQSSMKLSLADGKLTGTVAGRRRQGGGEAQDTPIEEATIKGDEISFKVTRRFGDNEFVQKYTAKITGDTLKGKITFDRGGETQSRDWEAKREAAK